MPIRFYTYKQRGFHYFLADLCYFVNLLLLLSIWVFPNSKRLFISTYCLAMGNNAIAIAMWRNSLVFHSLDKVTRYVSRPVNSVFSTWLTHRQSLYPHNALRHPPLHGSPHRAIAEGSTLPSFAYYPHICAVFARTLLSSSYDVVVDSSIRHLAALLPLPHHRPPPRRDCRRPANILHLAQEVLRLFLVRKGRHCPSKLSPRASFHAHPIRIRRSHHASMPNLVLVQMGLCRLLDGGVYVECV